jgi:hypothetical protein
LPVLDTPGVPAWLQKAPGWTVPTPFPPPLSSLSLLAAFFAVVFVVVADFGAEAARCAVVVRRGVVGTAARTARRATASSAPLP